MEDDLEEIRRRKMMEYQEALRQRKELEELERQRAAAEIQKEAILRRILTPEAKARLSRVRLANPELAEKTTATLIYLYQVGRITKRLTDGELKTILARISSSRRDTRIVRK